MEDSNISTKLESARPPVLQIWRILQLSIIRSMILTFALSTSKWRGRTKIFCYLIWTTLYNRLPFFSYGTRLDGTEEQTDRPRDADRRTAILNAIS